MSHLPAPFAIPHPLTFAIAVVFTLAALALLAGWVP